jgi:hypothetical protein
MPTDRRDAFKKIANIQGDEFDISEFRKALATHLPASLFGLAEDSQEYEALIDRYAFDGLTLGQIQNWIEAQGAARKNPRFEPLSGEVFVEYKFNKKSNRAYQVDAAEGAGNLVTDGLFTTLGLAVPTSLHAGKPVEFEKDDIVLVDQFTADGYARPDGTQVPPFNRTEDVTEVSRRFIRQLNDYPYILQDLKSQANKLDEETKQVVANNTETQKALDDADSQIRVRDEVITKLAQDQQNLRQDLEMIQMLFDSRTRELEDIKQQIESLDREIKERQEVISATTRIIRSRPASTAVVESSR